MLPVSLVGTAFKRLFFQSLISLRRSKNSTHLHIPESRGRRTGPRGSHLTQGTLQFALNARKIVSAENNELPAEFVEPSLESSRPQKTFLTSARVLLYLWAC